MDLGKRWEQIRASHRGQMLAIQGRRQVGKSTVLTTFVENLGAPYLYFTAIKNAAAGMQLELLQLAGAQARTPLPDSDMFTEPATSWTEAFSRLALAARQQLVVVVFDEFPLAVERSATIEGELQAAWDSRFGAPAHPAHPCRFGCGDDEPACRS